MYKTIKYDEEIRLNSCSKKPKEISDDYYGKFLKLITLVKGNNEIKHSNGKPLSKKELISTLEMNSERSYEIFIKKLIDINLIAYYKKKLLVVNPKYCLYNTVNEDVLKLFNYMLYCNSLLELPNNLSGIYRLYNDNDIVYIGKSINIKNRIKEHIKDKIFNKFDFAITNNESDKNLYEIYYIDKFKPVYNKDCITTSKSTIEIIELEFSNIILI